MNNILILTLFLLTLLVCCLDFKRAGTKKSLSRLLVASGCIFLLWSFRLPVKVILNFLATEHQSGWYYTFMLNVGVVLLILLVFAYFIAIIEYIRFLAYMFADLRNKFYTKFDKCKSKLKVFVKELR